MVTLAHRARLRPLDRKLVRDLWHLRGQAIAIGLLTALATSSFIALVATAGALATSRDEYYDAHGFGHVFAQVRRAPRDVLPRLAALPGVARVDGRVAGEGRLELAGTDAPVTARLLSLPPDGAVLDRPYLRRGRQPEPMARDEALVSEGFAAARGLAPGSVVTVVAEGRRLRLRVVGVAISPALIYTIRPGELFPDDAHYGVLWVPEATLAPALGLDGAFDEVTLRLASGAREREVITAVDDVLAPYGSLGAYGRDRHVSHRFLSDEIDQLHAMAVAIPGIFFAVTAYLVAVAMSRLVATQRQQIGMLRALGYGRLDIGAHYAKLTGAIGLAGALVGVAGGDVLGRGLATWYADFYRLPWLTYAGHGAVVVVAVGLGLAAALAGSVGAVRHAAALAPAEAMRPPAPASFHPGLVERLGMTRLLSPVQRMVARELGRRPLRAAMGTLGLASAVAILVVGSFSTDAVARLMTVQFEHAQRQDLTVTLASPRSAAAVAAELESLPGVTRVEVTRALPARLVHGHRGYTLAISGVERDAELQRVVDDEGLPAPLPREGLLVSRQLAHILAVGVGDEVWVEVLEGYRRSRAVPVGGIVDDLLGVGATAPLPFVSALAGDGELATGAVLRVDAGALEAVTAELWRRPLVASTSSRVATRRAFDRTMAEVLDQAAAVLILFAVCIAVGVVYNTARVAFAERERDLATARVLGFTRLETLGLLLGELGAQLAAAVPVGLGLGWGLSALAAQGMASDLFRMPLVLSRATLVTSPAVVVGACLATSLVVWRWIARLQMVEALRSRE
jgi:putative ABC transport system permease protein